MPTAARNENVEKLRDLIKGIKVAMLTTAEENGKLYSRPMATQETDFDGDLWFFSKEDSPKVEEVERVRHVNVSYAAPEHNRYVSVTGNAHVLHDKRKMEELWSSAYKSFFPKGLEEPGLCLLKVTVEQAEYWDGPSGVVGKAIHVVKSLAHREGDQMGDNEKLSLKK